MEFDLTAAVSPITDDWTRRINPRAQHDAFACDRMRLSLRSAWRDAFRRRWQWLYRDTDHDYLVEECCRQQLYAIAAN